MRTYSRLIRLLRNLFRDLRHGAFLGGMKKTPHAHHGAYDTANSAYEALEQIFSEPAVAALARTRTVVDVGCGKGRVLNFLIDALPGRPILGIEIDQAVAVWVSSRLRRHDNVTILPGDVRSVGLPLDALFYLFNPFDAGVMREFADRLDREERIGSALIYYNPMHLDIFEASPRFAIKDIKLAPGYHRCVLITVRRADGACGPG